MLLAETFCCISAAIEYQITQRVILNFNVILIIIMIIIMIIVIIIIIMISLMTMQVTSILGNTLVLWTVLFHRRMWSLTNYFLVSFHYLEQ